MRVIPEGIPNRLLAHIVCLSIAGLGALAGCRERPPESAAALTGARVESLPAGPVDPRSPTVLARAITHALATRDMRVYFGDMARGGLFAVSKAGEAPPVQVGPRAPVDVAFGPTYVAWIGAPGDVLLRDPPRAAPLTARGVFTALAADGDDLYVTDAGPRDGTLLHVSEGGAVRRMATFAERPRNVALDGCDAYVVTDGGIHRVARAGEGTELLAAGQKLTGLALTPEHVFVTTELPTTRGLLRVDKRSGKSTVLASDVRNGPIATWDDHVYFFDAKTPAVMRVATRGGAPTVVAQSPELGWAVALAVDASGVYVAAAYEHGGTILSFDHPS